MGGLAHPPAGQPPSASSRDRGRGQVHRPGREPLLWMQPDPVPGLQSWFRTGGRNTAQSGPEGTRAIGEPRASRLRTSCLCSPLPPACLTPACFGFQTEKDLPVHQVPDDLRERARDPDPRGQPHDR